MGSKPIFPIRVGIENNLSKWDKEIQYVFNTLLKIAGFPVEYIWCQNGASLERKLDLYYGSSHRDIEARIYIPSSGRDFLRCPDYVPEALIELDHLAYITFPGDKPTKPALPAPAYSFAYDIIFSSYWLLIGAAEPFYRRNKVDDFDLEGFFFHENWLFSKPLVSVYGRFIRDYFKDYGYAPADYPWVAEGKSAAIIFTHDVDYPQIIRWIEALRLIRSRGRGGIASALGVLQGSNHFWKFSDWTEFEAGLGARAAFYFMARKGSLLEYAMGVPDSFYDIRRPEFIRLFRELKETGFEIGLHASFNAYQSLDTLVLEKQKLERLAGVPVIGNRFHYWHLDPDEPHETLKLSEQAGLIYDSSLGYEFYPGFRRGICHPFRVFHPGDRRELDIIELPPTWMDNHFDKRLLQNKISDPIEYARNLVETACELGGMIIVDYHARGMNADFYPRFGPWIRNFVEENLSDCVAYHSPKELAEAFLEYERELVDTPSNRGISAMSEALQGNA